AGARFPADAGADRLDRFNTRTGAATIGYATGFTHAGGLTTRFAAANPVNGTVMVLDDPSAALLAAPVGAGRAFLVGRPVARVTGGPTGAPGGLPPAPGFTSSSTPGFTVTGFGMDGAAGALTLRCRLFARGANPALVPWQDCTGGSYRQLAPVGEGAYVFAVQAVQGVAGIEQPVAVTVDLTPPAAPVVTVPADGSLVGGSPAFAFSGAEPDLAFRCSLDGAPEAPCVAGPTFSFAADGDHVVSVRAVDRAGNESVASTPVAFHVDATP